jgi:hypothetical protein
MTLAALARRNRLRSYTAAKASHRPGAVPRQTIVSVEFSSPDGRTLQAIGGGDTLAAAIAFARDSCPADANWQPVRWSDLYGD